MKNIIIILVLIITACGCATTVKVEYNFEPGSKERKAICDRSIGVLIFADKRDDKDKKRMNVEDLNKVISKIIVSKFNQHCINSATYIDVQTDRNNSDLLQDIKARQNVDYILLGSIDKFVSEYNDKYSILRFTGAFVSGFTAPQGLVIFPFCFMGNVEHITEIDLNNLELIDANGNKVVWKGQIRKDLKEKVLYIRASASTFADKVKKHSEDVLDELFESVASAYSNGFQVKTIVKESAYARDDIVNKEP